MQIQTVKQLEARVKELEELLAARGQPKLATLTLQRVGDFQVLPKKQTSSLEELRQMINDSELYDISKLISQRQTRQSSLERRTYMHDLGDGSINLHNYNSNPIQSNIDNLRPTAEDDPYNDMLGTDRLEQLFYKVRRDGGSGSKPKSYGKQNIFSEKSR